MLDNCAIHHSEELHVLVEEKARMSCIPLLYTMLTTSSLAECRLMYLPPYSPDFNPIEQAFLAIKAYLHRHWQDDGVSIIDRACSTITPLMAWGFYKTSGYVV